MNQKLPTNGHPSGPRPGVHLWGVHNVVLVCSKDELSKKKMSVAGWLDCEDGPYISTNVATKKE